MSDKSDDLDDEPFEFSTDDIDSVQSQTTAFLKQRLILWVVRWTVGFALIWWAVSQWPQLDWLWWFGGIVAAASLTLIVLSGWLLQRRISKGTERIHDLQHKIQELEREQRSKEDRD